MEEEKDEKIRGMVSPIRETEKNTVPEQ